jgi:hypothetical protein
VDETDEADEAGEAPEKSPEKGAATFYVDVREGDSNVISSQTINGGITINNHSEPGRTRRRRGE